MNKSFAIALAIMALSRAAGGLDLSCGASSGVMQGKYIENGDDFVFPYKSLTVGGGLSKKIGDWYSLSLKLNADMPTNGSFSNQVGRITNGHSVQAALGFTLNGQDASLFIGPVYRSASFNIDVHDKQNLHEFDGVGSLASLYYPLTDHIDLRLDAQYTINHGLSVLDYSKQNRGVLHTGSTQIGVALSSGAVIEA